MVAVVFSYHFFDTKRTKMAVKTLWAATVETLFLKACPGLQKVQIYSMKQIGLLQ